MNDDIPAGLINLADGSQGAQALWANDEFFAAKERMLQASEPVFRAGTFDEHGQWMDGWETRRRRTPGHDSCIVRLAYPGVAKQIDLDTRHFTGNYPPAASIEACLEHLPDAGFNMLNWGKQTDIADVIARIGGRMCLMGNVNPLEIAVRGTPEDVYDETTLVLEKSGGDGIILSVGGGVSPGMPRQNIVAMQKALADFNARIA